MVHAAPVSDDRRAGQLRVAIGLLRWTVRDLHLAALGIGSPDSELDLIKYLGTGSPVEARFFAAIAVNEELREQGLPFRVDEDFWQPRRGTNRARGRHSFSATALGTTLAFGS